MRYVLRDGTIWIKLAGFHLNDGGGDVNACDFCEPGCRRKSVNTINKAFREVAFVRMEEVE